MMAAVPGVECEVLVEAQRSELGVDEAAGEVFV